MSYKFVKITTLYREYLNNYYEKNRDIISKSYNEQFAHLMSDFFGWSNYFQVNFGKIGVDAYEIISNALPLQKSWAKEHNLKLNNNDLVLEQLKYLKPEIVFIQDTNTHNGKWVEFIKDEVPSIKKIIGWCCSPYKKENIDLYKPFDFILTCSPKFNIEFQNYGLKSYQMYHAFEPMVLKSVKEYDHSNIIDLIFAGSIIPGNDFHNERIILLEKIIEFGVDINIYSNIIHDNYLTLVSKQLLYVINKYFYKSSLLDFVFGAETMRKINGLNSIPRNYSYSENMLRKLKKPIYGFEMFKALSNAKIGLNIHGGVAGDYAANIRLFEITGVGACLLTDWKKNLPEMFNIDTEIVTYKNTAECIEKVKWLINHPKECHMIGKAGQIRTLKDHTFENRIKLLDQIIKKELYN